MRNLIQRIFIWLFIVRLYKEGDKQHHRFNPFNPLGWTLLLIVAFIAGVVAGGRMVWIVIYEVMTAHYLTDMEVKQEPEQSDLDKALEQDPDDDFEPLKTVDLS